MGDILKKKKERGIDGGEQGIGLTLTLQADKSHLSDVI